MILADFGRLRTGSAQPFIPNSSLASMPVLRPSAEVLDVFCSVARPLRLEQQRATAESRTLATLRDTLLPRLVSGELRVNATACPAEEAAELSRSWIRSPLTTVGHSSGGLTHQRLVLTTALLPKVQPMTATAFSRPSSHSWSVSA